MASILTDHLRRAHRHNVRTLRTSPLSEISGALGDLGTLLPLMIALSIQGSIRLDSTLVFSGAFNVATGIAFGVPLPVQPMKVSGLRFYNLVLFFSFIRFLGAIGAGRMAVP
jgi:hypothetical protein